MTFSTVKQSPNNILITGATGYLGGVLVHQLKATYTNAKLFALVRQSSNTDFLPKEISFVYGDISDEQSVMKAVKGMDVVFDTAGMISISPFKDPRLIKVNVEGTRHVIKACLENDTVLVKSSSSNALQITDESICEKTAFPSKEEAKLHKGDYSYSKWLGSLLVKEACENDGLKASVLFPSGIVGPFDSSYNSRLGDGFIRNVESEKPVYVKKASFNYVDVRDVAKAHIAAYENERYGEAYILAGNDVKSEELLDMVNVVCEKPSENMKGIPHWLIWSIAWIVERVAYLRNQESILSTSALSMLQENYQFNSEKAVKELGFSPRPTETSVHEELLWYQMRQRIDVESLKKSSPLPKNDAEFVKDYLF